MTNGVLDILHLCKSLHLSKRLFHVLQNIDSWVNITTRNTKALHNILQNLHQQDPLRHLAQTLLKQNNAIHFYIHSFTELLKLTDKPTKALTRSTKNLLNILQVLDEKNPLQHLVQTMLRLYKHITLLYSYIDAGDIHAVILVGIHKGKEGLANFVATIKAISIHTGLSPPHMSSIAIDCPLGKWDVPFPVTKGLATVLLVHPIYWSLRDE